jgi:hypothetical protein
MNGTTATMHCAIKEWGLKRTMRPKICLGKDELVQLIDYDMTITTNMEVAEMHHLPWSLQVAWICGVRPSSLVMLWVSFWDSQQEPYIDTSVMVNQIS